mmetsp:Transcript_16342/g.57091  ORF Transcript_16342/g.57091 Transcript_16342/m.57091 type:complete len:266 (+) Transcript_16342:80-877(+)|eukprot:CAMPEP_0203965464 /NCGR_PEP_ID=MMETSP0359-20131031/94947_1 /ASSEMBLY_ACC=CAM_ASM_000338 /TAXON_ID=268821 /ORGANISM="Scrippsiella Hangoei, Strain SHTV-5" /LENGTH=265 /DNA_ID=CAMNT_0050902371 /DNA_START=83 /DNA_END=880 /DNA_ORIENTATION=+
MVEQTLYEVVGVSEDASSDELIKAYRQKALEQHPDKGGDKDQFDELVKAFKTLENSATRDAYDAELARLQDRAKLVLGGPSGGAASKQQAQAPMARQKTAPTAGSTRQSKLGNIQPGGPEHCAHEWKGMRSGAYVLKMICDGVTDEQKTKLLFDKYDALPRGKDKKREWLSSIRGQEKKDLKAIAKKKEGEDAAKWSKWLQNGPSTAKVVKKAPLPSRPAKAKPSAATESPSAETETPHSDTETPIPATDVPSPETAEPCAVAAE